MRLTSVIIMICTISIFLISSRYINANDIQFYNKPLLKGELYPGDVAFEYAQIVSLKILGRSHAIHGLQFLLAALAGFYAWQNVKSSLLASVMTILLIFSSPLLLVGITNGLRQTIAFFIILIAFNLRSISLKFFMILLSVLFHKAAIVLIGIIMIYEIASPGSSFFRAWSRVSVKLYFAIFCLLLIIDYIFIGFSISFVAETFDRYFVYIDSALVLSVGRFGDIKMLVWLSLWLLIVALSIAFRTLNENRSSLVFGTYSFFLFLDAQIRGYDEFHSRMVYIGYALIFVWFTKQTSISRDRWPYVIMASVNLLSPSTYGTLL